MQNKWRIGFFLLAVGTAVLFFFYLDGCNKQNGQQKDFDTLLKIHYADSTELVKKTNALGQITVTAQAYELSQKDLDRYVAENLDLKQKLVNAYHHVNSVSSTATNLHADTVKIKVPVHDTLPCADIDKSYPVKDTCFSFNFQFKNRRGHDPQFFFTNLNAPDTATTIIGVEKYGFLNMRRKLVSEQTHTNKCIEIKGVKTVVKAEAKPKTLKKIAIGFGMGVLATVVAEYKLSK